MTDYNLYKDDGQGVTFSLYYTGTCTEIVVDKDIETGILYSFYVTATNFNGEGIASDVTQLKACIAPQDVDPPVLVSNTDLKAILRWTYPGSDGGCDVYSYAIFTDLGDIQDNLTTQLAKTETENKPYMFEYEFDFTSSETGKDLRFKLEATNE